METPDLIIVGDRVLEFELDPDPVVDDGAEFLVTYFELSTGEQRQQSVCLANVRSNWREVTIDSLGSWDPDYIVPLQVIPGTTPRYKVA